MYKILFLLRHVVIIFSLFFHVESELAHSMIKLSKFANIDCLSKAFCCLSRFINTLCLEEFYHFAFTKAFSCVGSISLTFEVIIEIQLFYHVYKVRQIVFFANREVIPVSFFCFVQFRLNICFFHTFSKSNDSVISASSLFIFLYIKNSTAKCNKVFVIVSSNTIINFVIV